MKSKKLAKRPSKEKRATTNDFKIPNLSKETEKIKICKKCFCGNRGRMLFL